MHQPDPVLHLEWLANLAAAIATIIFEEPSLSDVYVYPNVPTVRRANELTVALGVAKGINFDIGSRLFGERTSMLWPVTSSCSLTGNGMWSGGTSCSRST